MPRKLLILDFDGSLTLLELEAASLCRGYLADVSDLVALRGERFDAEVADAEAVIAADPDHHGWVNGGLIVAPALVDPYVDIQQVSNLILSKAGFIEPWRDRVLHLLFKHHAPKVESVFKPKALEALLGIDREAVAAYVVTNSQADPVKKKLEQLGANGGGENYLTWLIERVNGSAKKYEVDPNFDSVEATLTLPGLGRPVHLRRPVYYGVLDRLRREHGLEWNQVTVVGDIFELDLALPFALGARIGLFHNDRTPAYERAFIRANHPRARLLDEPLDILTFIAE